MASTTGRVGRIALVALLAACADDKLADASVLIKATPDELDFGLLFVGDRLEREVELRNAGRAAASLSVASAPEGFLAEPATSMMPAGGTIRVRVIFAPTATGDRDGELVLAGGEASVTIAVRGAATARQVEAPARVDFGEAIVRHRAPGAVRLANQSALPMTLTARMTGANAASFLPDTGSILLPSGETVDFGVTFAPESRGPLEAVLRLQPCESCDPLEVVLEGKGLLDRVVAEPTSLSFGGVVVRDARELALTLRNTGDVDRPLGAFRVVPEAAPFHASGEGLPGTVARGATANFMVSFTPNATGARNATLEILDPQGELVVAVPLDGSGVESRATVTPRQIDFGNQAVNSATPRTVEVAVQGNALQVTGVTIEGVGTPFTASSARSTPATVGPPLAVTVTYQPRAAGSHGAVLVIQTDRPDEPEHRIPLAGNASVTKPCRLDVPSVLPFGLVGAGSASRKPLAFTNSDLGECQVTGLVIDGSAGPFSLDEVETPWVIAPMATRNLEVTYAPLAGASNSSNVSVRITSNNSSASTQWVRLSGTAFEGNLIADPDPVDFGTVSKGLPAIRAVGLHNAGEVPVSIANFNFASGAPSALTLASSPALPLVLAPGTGTTIALSWAPAATTSLATALEVSIEGHGVPKRVEIRGIAASGPCGPECHTPTAVCPGRVVTEVTKEVVLPGTGLDPDRDALTCQWSLISAPAGSGARLDARLPCDTALVPDIVGDYQLELEVKDRTGLQGTCRIEVHADPYSGLWLETFWDLEADVDLHLLHPTHHAGIDPFDSWSWGGTDGADCFYWTCRRGVATLAWPDTPGPLDDPSLDVDSQSLGPENIRIDVPSSDHPYWIGVHWLYNPLAHTEVRATTNVYCAGVLAATEVTTLFHRDHVVLGSIDVNPDGTCAFTPSGVRLQN